MKVRFENLLKVESGISLFMLVFSSMSYAQVWGVHGIDKRCTHDKDLNAYQLVDELKSNGCKITDNGEFFKGKCGDKVYYFSADKKGCLNAIGKLRR